MKPCASSLPPDTRRTLAETLARIGDKWSMMTIVTLERGETRFSALRRDIEGISQKMLTLTLRGLERDGYVARRIEPTKPPSVYYSLTPLGRKCWRPSELWWRGPYRAWTPSTPRAPPTTPRLPSPNAVALWLGDPIPGRRGCMLLPRFNAGGRNQQRAGRR